MAAVRCCRCWRERIPPTWLVICGVLVVQFGFGLYPTLVKKLAAQESADPYIFSFYRDSCCTPLLFICALVAERKILIPDLKILVGIYILMQKRCVFNKPQCRWKDYPVNVTAYSYFFGSIFMGMLSVYFAATKQYSKFHLPDDSIYLLIYAIFIASATCYLLMTWANVHIPATLVTAFWPANVLVTVVSSLFLTGDELAPLQYFGTVLLLIGLFLVLFANHMDERLLAHKPVIMLDCWCPVQKRQRKLVVISETKSQDLPSETASNHKSLFSNDTKSEADDEELVSTSCYKDASGRKNYGAIN